MIDVSPAHLQTILEILKTHAPDCEVRAFGSRVKWTAKNYSDLDLALVGSAKLPFRKLAALQTAFEESDLPYRVDVLDWLAISPEFQKVIEQGYEVIQDPKGLLRPLGSASGLAMGSSDWKNYQIGDIGKIVTGKTPPTQNSKNFGDKYPFITPKDMLGQKKIRQTERHLSEEGKNAIRNCLLPANSICVSCIGSDMGKVVMTTEDSVTNQQLNSIICSDLFDPDFVYYALINISDELRNVGHHSTAVPILNKTDFSNFKITAPKLPTQRRIAAILSALDEKIELNRQTNATLEAIAQAIFKEWFVDFNYPDPKGLSRPLGSRREMIESELGMIPQGWRVERLGTVVDVKGGTTPSTKEEKYWNGEFHWATPKDLSTLSSPILLNTERKITEEGVAQISSGVLPKGTLLLSSRAPIGYLAIADIPVSINQGFIAINTLYTSNLFILHWLKVNMEKVVSRANGSTFLEISKANFREIDLVVPDADTVKMFDNVVSPIFEQVKVNEYQSIILTQLRDSLLPKLMSGEIDVQDPKGLEDL